MMKEGGGAAVAYTQNNKKYDQLTRTVFFEFNLKYISQFVICNHGIIVL